MRIASHIRSQTLQRLESGDDQGSGTVTARRAPVLSRICNVGRFLYWDSSANDGCTILDHDARGSGDDPSTHLRCRQVLNDAELVATARARSAGGSVIITFANSRYADVLMNWLVALSLQRIDNYVVVTLDRELHASLSDRGIPSLLCEFESDLGDLWIQRIRIFAALCDAGVDFIHSDADAIWLQDPRGSYLASGDADLVASQGTVWPPDVHQRFGFVLCCGLFRLRSTPVSRRLLTELESHVLVSRDDQVSLNRLLAERSMRWHAQRADAYYLALGPKQFLCSRSLIEGVAADGLRASVLPHHLFQRVPVSLDDEPYVSHYLTPKDPQAKMLEFARHGHLFVRTDWREQKFDVTSLATLRR
jgi:hypothetical protein